MEPLFTPTTHPLSGIPRQPFLLHSLKARAPESAQAAAEYGSMHGFANHACHRKARKDGKSGGGYRHLTILFSDLAESVRLGGGMESDQYVEMLRDLRGLCRGIVARNGGHIARLQGDGVLAFFGFPESLPDDGLRAAVCALELHAAAREMVICPGELGVPSVALHSGIHAGVAYLERGDVERGRFDLVGNVPNLAARLSGLAGRDQLYISEQALGEPARIFGTNDRAVLMIRGWTDPLAVYIVQGQAQEGLAESLDPIRSMARCRPPEWELVQT